MLIVLAIVLPIGFVVMRSATPVVNLASPVTVLGQATPINVHVSDRNGIRGLTASVEQGGASYPVWQLAQPSTEADSTWKFTAGVKAAPQLKDGKAKLIVEATSNDLLRKSGRCGRRSHGGDAAAQRTSRFGPALPLSGHGGSGDHDGFRQLE